MAHFSNATEFEFWSEAQCWNCVHRDTDKRLCPINNLHFCYQSDVDDEILDILIPRTDNGNGVCQMFFEDENAERPGPVTSIEIIEFEKGKEPVQTIINFEEVQDA